MENSNNDIIDDLQNEQNNQYEDDVQRIATAQYLNDKIKKEKKNGLNVKLISDGHHTFDDLYYQRMILTAVIAKTYKDKAWRSKLHHDNTMFNGDFIVGFDTPEGQYSYHFKLKYWNEFDGVTTLENAPMYDGHKPKDVKRLLGLLNQ